jgi:hypothetical protein
MLDQARYQSVIELRRKPVWSNGKSPKEQVNQLAWRVGKTLAPAKLEDLSASNMDAKGSCTRL